MNFIFHLAEKMLVKIREKRLISQEEFNQISKLNRQKFNPLLGPLMYDKPLYNNNMLHTRKKGEWMRKIRTLDVTTSSVIKPKQKVAAYIRVSTSNEDQLISLEAQRRHYKTLIEKNNEWQLEDIYSEGVTGTKKERLISF